MKLSEIKTKKVGFWGILFEIIIAFVIIDTINYYFFKGHMGFINSRHHPYWLIIILISSRYGLLAGAISGVFSFLHYLYFMTGYVPHLYELEMLWENNNFTRVYFFIIGGLMLGGIRQMYIIKEARQSELIEEQNSELALLESAIKEKDKIIKVSEKRILGHSNSIKDFYNTFLQFELESIHDVLKKLVDVLEEHSQVQESVVFVKDTQGYVMVQHSHNKDVSGTPELQSLSSFMDMAFERNETMSLKDFLDLKIEGDFHHCPVAVIPMQDQLQNPFALVVVTKMDFYDLHQDNLHRMVTYVRITEKALLNTIQDKRPLVENILESTQKRNHF